MNCGAGPRPGSMSLREKKSDVDHRNALRRGRRVQPLRLRLLQQLLRLLLRDLLSLLLLQDRLDLGFDLVERLHVRFLLVVDANDVEAVAALHQVADLSLGQRERRLLKLRNGLALADPAQRSALLRAARVFRIFLGQLFELRAALQLLQQIFGALLRLGDALLVHFAVGPGSGVLIRMWLTFTCSGRRYWSRC